VGEIPQGLPKFSIPRGFQHVKSLISTAFLITGVAILLFGLGVANICGSFFSSYPSTGKIYCWCALAAIVISAVMGLVGVSLAFVIHESANPHIAVTYIDSSAVQALKDLNQEYRSRGIQVCLQHVQSSNPSSPKVSSGHTPPRPLSFLQSLWKQGLDGSTPEAEPLLARNEV
ncbi:hypothetical protein BHE74_00023667, partial [Ensete ventricosum]